MSKTTTLKAVYQIKVTLKHIRPPIWRRLLVPNTMRLSDLHVTLQIAMGWGDYHLHQFTAGNQRFGLPDTEWDDKQLLDERRFKVADILREEKGVLSYEYDFGDGWEHLIVLEKILPFDKSLDLPSCLTGKRACPPEDVGGPWGYEEFLETIGDAEAFDSTSVNQKLHENF